MTQNESEVIQLFDSTKLVTAKELATLLRVDPRTVTNMVRRGEIEGMKVGRHLRFEPSEVFRALKEKGKKDAINF